MTPVVEGGAKDTQVSAVAFTEPPTGQPRNALTGDILAISQNMGWW